MQAWIHFGTFLDNCQCLHASVINHFSFFKGTVIDLHSQHCKAENALSGINASRETLTLNILPVFS